MATFLFDGIVFGPVQSRRLGVSLGINLLPEERKYCNFDCIYCECGSDVMYRTGKSNFPARTDVYIALERKLVAMQQAGSLPDAVTFAGNGEPTVHPEFAGIIFDTVSLRDRYAPQSKISVLSNATMLYRQEVVNALRHTDMPILKLDSAIDATLELLNRPAKKVAVSQLIEQLKLLGDNCIVQTMFLRGTYLNRTVDNTTAEEVTAWESAILAIRPKLVTIYTIARDTPVETLYKISGDRLKEIAELIEKHGIPVQVSE